MQLQRTDSGPKREGLIGMVRHSGHSDKVTEVMEARRVRASAEQRRIEGQTKARTLDLQAWSWNR